MMKTFFLALLLTFGAFADDLYWDEAIDLEMQVPDSLKRTWNIFNTQTGLSLTVFNTDDEETNVLVIAKLPLTMFPELDEVDTLQLLLDEFIILENNYHIEELAPISPDFSRHFRFYIFEEEIEEPILMDIHLFNKNGYSCVILTGGLDSHSDDLDEFSEQMINNIRFVEAGQ